MEEYTPLIRPNILARANSLIASLPKINKLTAANNTVTTVLMERPMVCQIL
ncbi:hypothetical protein D3C73_1644680 [compost metagenome]